MNETISVIVPVYNVADYLPQCLESILNQDYGDLQVLLIDDGSTDDSGAICDQFAAQDSRIQVIHQKNGGAASAKNAGLRAATGKYLSFVDSDDYLELGAYGFLVKTLEETRADAVQGAFQEVYRSRTEAKPLKPETLEGFDYLLRFPKDFTCALLWNKLYRRELFNGVFFEEGHKIDDEYFTYQGFLQPRKVVCTDRVIYNYRKRASSVMGSPAAAEQRILDGLDSTAKRRQKVCAQVPALSRVFDENYLDVLWYLSGNTGNTERSLEALKSGLREYLCHFGNRFPPRYLWKGLLRLLITPTDALLADCQSRRKTADIENFFP